MAAWSRGARGGVVAVVALTLRLLELAFRVAYPTPPLPIIRTQGTDLRIVRGVPVWAYRDSQACVNEECVRRWPDAARVVLVGSPITFGTEVDAHEPFPARVQAAVDELLGPGRVCVQPIPQPGYSFLNKRVGLEDDVERAAPHVVIWGGLGERPPRPHAPRRQPTRSGTSPPMPIAIRSTSSRTRGFITPSSTRRGPTRTRR